MIGDGLWTIFRLFIGDVHNLAFVTWNLNNKNKAKARFGMKIMKSHQRMWLEPISEYNISLHTLGMVKFVGGKSVVEVIIEGDVVMIVSVVMIGAIVDVNIGTRVVVILVMMSTMVAVGFEDFEWRPKNWIRN